MNPNIPSAAPCVFFSGGTVGGQSRHEVAAQGPTDQCVQLSQHRRRPFEQYQHAARGGRKGCGQTNRQYGTCSRRW